VVAGALFLCSFYSPDACNTRAHATWVAFPAIDQDPGGMCRAGRAEMAGTVGDAPSVRLWLRELAQ